MIGQVLSTFVTLFVIIDPIGAVPVFLGLTGGYAPAQRRAVARRAILVAGGVLLFFALLGQALFDAIGVRLVSFEIGGGILLFLFGVKMIFGEPEGIDIPAERDHDLAVFPLAIPAIAGPGAMLGVVVAANTPSYTLMQRLLTAATLLVVLAITYVMLRAADFIQRWIGRTGSLILSRVMGVLLTAIATEMVLQALARLR